MLLRNQRGQIHCGKRLRVAYWTYMLSTRTAADLHAFFRLARKQPLFRVLDDDHKVAVGAALQSLDAGIFEFLALNDSRVRVVELDGKGFSQVSVVELGVTTIGVRTNDILIRRLISMIKVTMVRYSRLSAPQQRLRSSFGYILDRSCVLRRIEP
jgi:hypothetical protein